MNFAELYRRLDESNKTSEKLSTLVDYFGRASDRDASWAVFFLTGRRLPQPAPNKILRNWAANEAKIPDWLFEETYAWVGDLAETMSCVLPASTSNEEFSLSDWVDRIAMARERFETALDEGRSTAFDEYAAESAVEFFAVASECFFQDPHRLARHDADLHALLVTAWRQDPRQRVPVWPARR